MSEHVAGTTGTAATDPAMTLAGRLRGLHLPEPVGWWPPAPGWWALAAALLAAGAWALGRAWRRRHTRLRRRSLTNELQACHATWCETGMTATYYADCARVLRRAAIAAGGRARVARLSGERWVDWLDAHARTPFPDEVRDVLADALYRPRPPERVASVHRELLRWSAEHAPEHAGEHTGGESADGCVGRADRRAGARRSTARATRHA